MWYAGLLPVPTEIIGVYDHPPPEDAPEIRSFRVHNSRQAARLARKVTSVRDVIRDSIADAWPF